MYNMDPNKPIVLKGKHGKEFDKYQKRKATPEEIAFAKKAEKFYLKHPPSGISPQIGI